MPPLTHHQIIGLVEPFTRRGRQVELAASDRVNRRLVFKAIDHAGAPALRETLELENPHDGRLRLTRRLKLLDDAGVQASLTAEGSDAFELLQRVEAVAPQRHFSAEAGALTALDFRLDGATPILTEASSHFGGYTLTMHVPRADGLAATFELRAPAGAAVTLPEDLLAVIGWDWSPLRAVRAHKNVWLGRVRLRGGGPRRSAAAEAKLARTVQHLARTLSQPPAVFHAQHARARWGAALRRAIPLVTALGLFAVVALLPRAVLLELSPPLRAMTVGLPPLLLALAFSLQEMPRFEIPPWPRRLAGSAWPLP